MKVISENVGPMVVDTVKKLIEEAIPRIKEFLKTTGIEKIGEAGSKAGNKGYDCALSAIEMVNLEKVIRG